VIHDAPIDIVGAMAANIRTERRSNFIVSSHKDDYRNPWTPTGGDTLHIPPILSVFLFVLLHE